MDKDNRINSNSNSKSAKNSNILHIGGKKINLLESTVKKVNKRLPNKGMTKKLASLLYYRNEHSTLRKAYQNSIYCAEFIKQENGKYTSSYCKNRWCLVCQRIRMGKLINEKVPRLKQCKNLYFVTISRPNVKGKELKGEITDFNKTYAKITRSRTYKKYIDKGCIGIVKSECTIRPNDEYHYHKHILVDNKEFGLFIRHEWMRLNPTAHAKGQDFEKVYKRDGSFLEIFKYMTKLIGKDAKGKSFIDVVRLNVIFEAFSGKQVFKNIGKKESWKLEPTEEKQEKVEEDILDEIEETSSNGIEVFKFIDTEDFWGYYEVKSGETLAEVEAIGDIADIAEIINGKKETE